MSTERELYELKSQAHSLQQTDPQRSVALFTQVADGFRALGKEREELEATHWLLQTLNHHCSLYSEALEIGVRAIVKARKSVYNDFKTRICLQEDLISTYLGLDPEGYEPEIRELLAYMQREITDGMSCSFCLRYRSFNLECWLENFELAQQIALQSLAKCQGTFHEKWYRVGYLSDLCTVACLSALGRDQLLDWARDYEESARQRNPKTNLADAAMYIAVGHLARGEEAEAKNALRRAKARFNLGGNLDFTDYFDGARAYAKLAGKSSHIPTLCDEELQRLQSKTAPARTARVHRWKCEALAELEILDEKTLQVAREHAAKLRPPQNELKRLEKLTPNF